MITVSLPLYLLVIANAALIVAAAFAVMRVERALRDTRKFWTSPTGAAMQADRDTPPGPDNRHLVQKIAALQLAIEDLGRRERPAAQERVVDISLQHAVRMAKRGATVEELSRDCGLNVGEAKLLRRLHVRQSGATPFARSA
jgi:hypothetical protein